MAWIDPDEMTTTGVIDSATFTLIRDDLKLLYRKPIVTVRLTAAQSVANASDHVVQWDEAEWDFADTAMWDVGTPGSIVIDRPGIYEVVPSGLWEGTTDDSSKREVAVELNGTTRLTMDSRLSTSSPEGQAKIFTNLGTGDYLEIVVRHLSGAAIDLQPTRTRCTVAWWGPAPTP